MLFLCIHHVLTINRPQTPKELFNLRHASARNIIERIFGVFKARFKILVSSPAYKFAVQAKLIAALAVVHNFIATHDQSMIDDALNELDAEQGLVAHEEQEDIHDFAIDVNSAERHRANEFRDRVAERMWIDYQAILERRRIRG